MIWIFVFFVLFFSYLIYNNFQDISLLKSVTSYSRGTQTERHLVLELLKNNIPQQAIFHDLYLENKGKFTQIDLVVPTKVGIIVFEVKNYKGWIFGSGNQRNWTQVLAYGKQKFRFYNPILQNNTHIQQLRNKLTLENVPMFSVVVFYGDCTFKEIEFIPNNTYLVKSKRVVEVVRSIIKNNEPAKYKNKREVVRILNEAVLNGNNPQIKENHIDRIEDMHGKHRIYD